MAKVNKFAKTEKWLSVNVFQPYITFKPIFYSSGRLINKNVHFSTSSIFTCHHTLTSIILQTESRTVKREKNLWWNKIALTW